MESYEIGWVYTHVALLRPAAAISALGGKASFARTNHYLEWKIKMGGVTKGIIFAYHLYVACRHRNMENFGCISEH